MTAGPVNRALLESNFQNPGDVYSDLKTEGAFDVIADQVDDNWNYTAGLVNAGTLVPYPASMSRQAIINGNFDIWQRGTNPTPPASGGIKYLADRWQDLANADVGGTLPTLTVSRQTLPSGDIENSYYFYRLTTDGAGVSLGANSSYITQQKIENGTRYLCGSKKLTLSFWARSSIPNKRIGLSMSQNYGTGGSPSAEETMNAGTTFTLTSTWSRYTVTFQTVGLVGKTFGTNNDDYVLLRFWHMWGSSFNFIFGTGSEETFVGAGNIDIAQVQVSVGDVSIPFMPKTIEDELQSCQRYYETSDVSTTMVIPVAATEAVTSIKFAVNKRVTPTMTIMAADGTEGQISGFPGIKEGVGVTNYPPFTSVSGCGYLTASSGLTTGATRYARWIADAEL